MNKNTKYPCNGKTSINKEGNPQIYFHVCNGGPSFYWDFGSGCLITSVSCEGWMNTDIKFQMHSENLRELALWLLDTASKIDEKNKDLK